MLIVFLAVVFERQLREILFEICFAVDLSFVGHNSYKL